ncbi:cytochrome P450 [Amycolatopsis sp. H20-H5]|uniref:cytochrome P450 n=1 Tax=Amycolatopsis sp. H20-H5 TaxID=3046309 RepID=UPI002DB7EE39|nr:cytochrome P450 [Amycolatopsis sp. H20-H5]MEC3979471.1 cytochrome P450 [Amycolatopsis sp. H20-H5]
MTEVAEPGVTTFPMTRTCPFSPPPKYKTLREETPISRVELPTGASAWVLTKLADIRQMLTDPRFSSDRQHPGFPLLVKGGRPFGKLKPSLISMDAPEHGPARREVVGEFTVKRMKALQPRIQEIVDERIDAMLAAGGTVDLVELLSLPVPSLVICEQLGVPYADHDFFQAHSSALLNRDTAPEDRLHAVDELQQYLSDLVTGKEAEPTDDLIGRQIVKTREEGTYDHESLVSLSFLLLIAGHETTANMISLGTLNLLQNPEQLAAIKADPGKTLEAVEELLRFFTIADLAASRVAIEDAEIGGQLIRAGEGVLGLGYAANRDAEAFDNPDEFDIARGARHHVAFGFGAHQCLGQNLARMELQIVFDTLFRRLPGLKLAVDVDDLPFKHDSAIFGLYRMPVTW